MRKFLATLASVSVLASMLVIAPAQAATHSFDDVSPANSFYEYIMYLTDGGVFSKNPEFNPKAQMTRGEVAKTLVGAADVTTNTSCDHEFADVAADNTFYTYIKTMVCSGMVSENENFRPSDFVTRGEFAKMKVNAFGVAMDTSKGPSFTDVPADHTFYSYIETLVAEGAINGYGNGTFGPGNNVLRQEAAKIVAFNRGYGVYGEAAAIMLEASEDMAAVGNSVSITARVVDADGLTVRNYDGDVEFIADAGRLGDTSVQFMNGQASTTLTSFIPARVTVSAKTGDFNSAKAVVEFVIATDEQMALRAADYNLYPGQKTTLYLTLMDEDGLPLAGSTDNFTFTNEGSGILGTTITQVSSAKGVYAVDYTASDITEVDTVNVDNNELDLSTSVAISVAQPTMEVEVLTPNVSVGQTTDVLIKLYDADGAPLTGKSADLSARVLNTDLGAVSAVTELGGGLYYTTFTADNREATAKVEVKYNTVPVTHEYVDVMIHPNNIVVDIYPKTINTLNGVATVVVRVTDANGQPVNIDPTTAFDFDVRTGADVVDPSGDESWDTAADWAKYPTAGVYVTTITANTSSIEDSTVDVVVEDNSTVNATVSTVATVAVEDPAITTAEFFMQAGTLAAPTDGTLVVEVEDTTGNGLEGLLLTDFQFKTTTGGAYAAATGTFTEVGGGLYVIDTIGTNVVSVAVGNRNIAEAENITPVQSTKNNEYVFYGDNRVVERVAGADTGVRTGVAVMALDATSTVVAAPAITATGSGVASFSVLGACAVATCQQVVVTSTDAIEVETVQIATANTFVTNKHQKVITVHPIELTLLNVDTNAKAITTTQTVLIPMNEDGYIASNIMTNTNVTGSVEDSADEGTVVVNELALGTTSNNTTTNDGLNVFVSEWTRSASTDDIGDGYIEFTVDNDDDNLVKQMFEVVNPMFEVFVTSDTVIAAWDGATPVGTAVATPSYVSANDAYIFALARNDHGVPAFVAADLGGNEITLEVTSGDGFLSGINTQAGTTDTLNLQAADHLALTGMYGAFYRSEEDEGMATVEVYTQYDDNDTQSVEIATVFPTASLVLFPNGINPETTNDEAYALVVVYDQFNNPMKGLEQNTDQLLIEFDGDNSFTGTYNELYVAEYSTEDDDTYSVEVIYNDDAVIAEDMLTVVTNNT